MDAGVQRRKQGPVMKRHVVEQSDFPVYERIHEAIIAEEDWELAQEKRSKNNYRREKIHDPEHAHILSGILKCLCCGKGMYGNIAKAGRKDNKIRVSGKTVICVKCKSSSGGNNKNTH